MTRQVGYHEALLELSYLLSGPPIEPYPPLTRELLRSMRCRFGEKCFCEYCRSDEKNRLPKLNWHESQEVRPHRRYEAPFGSLNAALELLLRWRQDGPGIRSTHGSMISRCEEAVKLGTYVQTTQRYDRDDLMIRRAEYATDIERALARGLRPAVENYPVTLEQWIAILLQSVDAQSKITIEHWAEFLDVSPATIKRLLKHGRRLTTIELAVVGLIPDPRDETLIEEIELRREENKHE